MVFNVTPNRRETKEDAAFTNVSPTVPHFFPKEFQGHQTKLYRLDQPPQVERKKK